MIRKQTFVIPSLFLCAIAACAGFVRAARAAETSLRATIEKPKGQLLIVGGGGTTDDMLARALSLHGGAKAHVVVFPQASSLPETGAGSCEMWSKAGAGAADEIKLDDEAAATKLVDAADIIWFPGGVQARLMEALSKTKLPDRIRARYQAGALCGGTSAGAAVMSKVMLTGEIEGATKEESGLTFIHSQTVENAEGLGLIAEAIVDQHFVKRQRFSRLLSAVLDHPELVGIGIDEKTAILVQAGGFEVLGASNVLVIDARAAKVGEATKGKPAAANGMKLDLLRAGMKFELTATPTTSR